MDDDALLIDFARWLRDREAAPPLDVVIPGPTPVLSEAEIEARVSAMLGEPVTIVTK